ncbi:DUF3422 domain-containing protein [Herbaspirillum sp. RTI4]|uniref:DUF3422 family protein n=1 Tax=Herbaspirillum sp. RTI4 TaxID=3048640 RepID=UPI002AB5A0CD|nr:DUF3422 domain-containing protein [Herbaspirillum sp. RTI4]MDY7577101.1 DUF3422 domain-containing protein [Herbaspirillum sp. RTI4]MEA9982843.1 DUF3422 domain-containing protein [Herbaspirillum sp. RTI4]
MTNLNAHMNHPLRLALASEIHSRPFMVFDAPARISHLAIHYEERERSHHVLLDALCTRFGVAVPHADAQHFFHDFGHFRIKWEKHAEFSTYTFVEPVVADNTENDQPDFVLTAMRHVPADWLALLDSAVIVASHIATARTSLDRVDDHSFRTIFPSLPMVGSKVLSDGEIWSDFLIGPDGFSRYLIRDVGLQESQMGRLVQRICEIETYLMMALLALPHARQGTALLARVEEDLTALGVRMSTLEIDGDAESLLQEISRLDAQIRSMSFKSGYRFSAAQAYYRIVGARIGELRERRIEGIPTIGEFMERRLAPAMDTCISVAARQEAIAMKISRANDMLHTHVNLAQERQSQRVLHSLSRSARLQLQMQQAVEGLSVVAISYYGLGLAGYGLKALKGWGLAVPVDQTIGLLLPLVCGAVWMGIRRLHHRLKNQDAVES